MRRLRDAGAEKVFREVASGARTDRPQLRRAIASCFGVPQTRRRLFLLCDREHLPDPVAKPITPVRSAREILDRVDAWRSTPLQNGKRATATLERAERAIKVLGRGVPFLVVYYGSDRAGGWHSLDRPIRQLTTLDLFGLVTWDGGIPMLRMLQVTELKRAMGFKENFRPRPGPRVATASGSSGMLFAQPSWRRLCVR